MLGFGNMLYFCCFCLSFFTMIVYFLCTFKVIITKNKTEKYYCFSRGVRISGISHPACALIFSQCGWCKNVKDGSVFSIHFKMWSHLFQSWQAPTPRMFWDSDRFLATWGSTIWSQGWILEVDRMWVITLAFFVKLTTIVSVFFLGGVNVKWWGKFKKKTNTTEDKHLNKWFPSKYLFWELTHLHIFTICSNNFF